MLPIPGPLALLLIFGLTALGALFLIALTVTRPRRPLPEPICRRCQYPIRGHHSVKCPECGTLLIPSAIRTPLTHQRRRGSLTASGFAVAYLVLLALAAVGHFARPYLESFVANSTTVTQALRLRPTSGMYRELTVCYTSGTHYSQMDVAVSMLDAAGRTHWLHFTEDLRLQTKDPSGEGELITDHTAEAVDHLFTTAGTNLHDPLVRAEADELVTQLDRAHTVMSPNALMFTRFQQRMLPQTQMIQPPPLWRKVLLVGSPVLVAMVAWRTLFLHILRRRGALIAAAAQHSEIPVLLQPSNAAS